MAYALADDLATYWRPLSPDESTRAESLLSDASDLLDSMFPTLSGRIDDESLSETVPRLAVMQMVVDMMTRPTDFSGTSTLEVAGPFTNQQSFGAPAIRMRVSAIDKAILKLLRGGRIGQRAFTVDPTPVTETA